MDEDSSADGLDDVLSREVSRKQFFGVVGAAFLGMFGVLRFTEQLLNGNLEGQQDLTTSTQGLFGERQYGGDDEPHHAYNHEDSTY